MINVGDLIICVVSNPGTVTKGQEYVACGVKDIRRVQYVRVLGDDDRGHWLIWDLFQKQDTE